MSDITQGLIDWVKKRQEDAGPGYQASLEDLLVLGAVDRIEVLEARLNIAWSALREIASDGDRWTHSGLKHLALLTLDKLEGSVAKSVARKEDSPK